MRRASPRIVSLLLCAVLPLAACAPSSVAEPQTRPVRVEPIGESGLSRITLTARAAERIGIKSARVADNVVDHTLVAVGEVVAATDSAGAPSVRVQLNAGDFVRVDHSQPARILPVAQGGAGALVGHVTGEEQLAGYGDGAVYYTPDGQDQTLKVGERRRVELPLLGSGGRHLSVPYQAVLYDDHGDTWVFTNPEALVFVRAPVRVAYVIGDVAVLASGPPAGTRVVTAGVTELYGAEFGVGE